MNLCIFEGHLGRDPEVRHTQSGTAVATLNLATSEREKRDGEWVDHTEWIRVIVWAKQAERCAEKLAKGSRILVKGKMRTRKWQDRDGRDRLTTEVVAEPFGGVTFLAKLRGDTGAAGGVYDPYQDGGDDPGQDDIPY